jgi:hypothetical protein
VFTALVLTLALGQAGGLTAEDVVSDEVLGAVERLSRYPAGQVPVEPSTMGAITVIAEQGTRSEVGLLRSLVEQERKEVRDHAVRAIESLRQRQRQRQRARYVMELPSETELRRLARPWARSGLGPTSARAIAYATRILGEDPVSPPGLGDGDARQLLAAGQPRRALSVLGAEGQGQEELRLVARAREDAGDVRGALQAYTTGALAGDAEAEATLAEFGVEDEWLYLGLLIADVPGPVGEQDAPLLEALVRLGGQPTVEVLSEQMFRGGGSERASAADALVRLMEGPRTSPVTRDEIRSALSTARREGSPPVREIAAAALNGASSGE